MTASDADSAPQDPAAIDAAARLLEAGSLVAFPTETVYGLGADAENPAAVGLIYRAKERPANHPLIVHLAPQADVAYWSSHVDAGARALIDAFWPGPLTLILARAARIPDAVAGGQQSIGLRCPSHPVAQALLRSFRHGRGGIAAPSANRFGQVSPTTAQHVRDEFTDQPLVSCILDGGQSRVGIESTIVDLTRGTPVLLRPGHVGAAQIADVLGIWPAEPDAAAPRASGTLEAHYAPRTPLALVTAEAARPTALALLAAGYRLACQHHGAFDDVKGAMSGDLVLGEAAMPAHPHAYAHALYASLRRLDALGADLILVEAPPDGSDWLAVHDRLKRAAHGSARVLARMLAGTTR